MPDTGVQQPEYLRRREAAVFCKMSVSFLEKAERLGTGPKMSRLGKSPIYRIDDLGAWIESQVTRVNS
jgi:hypothetical protein